MGVLTLLLAWLDGREGQSILALGFTLDAKAAALCLRLARIMFPFLMLLAISSILMGLCPSHRRFSATTRAPTPWSSSSTRSPCA